jgi:hypothetical protein
MIMKSRIIPIVSILFSLVSTYALALEDQHPRPAFVPSTPPVTKAISEYSAFDVFGVVVTGTEQLPKDHPFAFGKKSLQRLKEKWPGTKMAEQFEVMMQIILDAPENADPREVHFAMDNMAYILQNVFDLPAATKADALVRIAGAQTVPYKRARAEFFAIHLFDEFLDPRIIGIMAAGLDDASVTSILRRESAPKVIFTVRGGARSRLMQAFRSINLDVDKAPFYGNGEEAGCAALKAWVAANGQLIATKCEEARAKPDRYVPNHILSCWDVRW